MISSASCMCVTMPSPGSPKTPLLPTDSLGLGSKKLEELAHNASDQVYGQSDEGPYQSLRQACTAVSTCIRKVALAMENGEYDFDGTQDKQIVPPIEVRSQTVKSELNDSENMKFKLESREENIVELRKQLKLKVDLKCIQVYLQSIVGIRSSA